jgi:hypothetical protein
MSSPIRSGRQSPPGNCATTSRSNSAPVFEFPAVDCQADICEIQAAGYENGNLNAVIYNFQMIVNAMHQQPWWNALGFDEQTLSTPEKQGRPLFIVYITRK